MRKILIIVIIAAMLMMCVPFAVSAKVGNTNLNYGTVTIDGNFSADKWSAAALLTVDVSNTISWVGGPNGGINFSLLTLG